MVYVTHYEEYPIYEPAEGGYYYTGIQMVESERMSKRAAKKLFKKLWEEAKQENLEMFGEEEPYDIKDGRRIYPWYYFCHNQPVIRKYSKFIGGGEYFVIERKQGKDEKGYEPYC